MANRIQFDKIEEINSFIFIKKKRLYGRLKENCFINSVIRDYPMWYIDEVVELFCDKTNDLYRKYEEF